MRDGLIFSDSTSSGNATWSGAVIVSWAVLGGIGASLLLPAIPGFRSCQPVEGPGCGL